MTEDTESKKVLHLLKRDAPLVCLMCNADLSGLPEAYTFDERVYAHPRTPHVRCRTNWVE